MMLPAGVTARAARPIVQRIPSFLRTISLRYRKPNRLWLFSVATLTFAGGAASPAMAEWYVGGQFGVSLPESISNAKLSNQNFAGGVSDARVNDLDRDTSAVWGGKIGYFSPDRTWLGMEVEAFTQRLQIKQQTVVGGVPGRVFSEVMPGSNVQLTTLAFNVILREPSLEHKLEPYGGIGPALFITSADYGILRMSAGINLIAGANYFLDEHWSLFGEFKYDRAPIKFGGISGNYAAQIFTVGVTYHFERPRPPSDTDEHPPCNC
jgi:opacity protein-like surface antigen